MDQIKSKNLAKVFLEADIKEKDGEISFTYDTKSHDTVRSFGEISEALDDVCFDRAEEGLGFEEEDEEEIPFS